jgi:hypothetical protein
MNNILLGNIVALTGALCMVFAGLLKTRKKILLLQCLQFALLGASNLILGAYTAVTSNLVGIVRNIFGVRHEFTVSWKVAFIVLQVVLALVFSVSGWISILPVIATCVFTWFLDAKNGVTLKVVIILTTVCWVIYDYVFQNYVTLFFDLAAIVTNIIGIISIRNRYSA